MTIKEIATKYGMNPRTLQKRAAKLGLGKRLFDSPRGWLVFTSKEVQELINYPGRLVDKHNEKRKKRK